MKRVGIATFAIVTVLSWAQACTDERTRVEVPREASVEGSVTIPVDPLPPLACPPAKEATPVPALAKPPPPPALFRDQCGTYLEDLVVCLFGEPDRPAECEALLAATAACQACLITSPDAQPPGPILYENGFAVLNEGDCMLQHDGRCGVALLELEACVRAACAGCDATHPAADMLACRSAARVGACAKNDEAASLCLRYAPDAAIAVCQMPGTFAQRALQLGALYCGPPPPPPPPPPPDGGAMEGGAMDAGAMDASAD